MPIFQAKSRALRYFHGGVTHCGLEVVEQEKSADSSKHRVGAYREVSAGALLDGSKRMLTGVKSDKVGQRWLLGVE